jgi:hypothetical protein
MNTRYYLDTEFNSFGGSLISLGIVRHDDPEDHLYLFVPKVDTERMRVEEGIEPWIEENVLKNLYALPDDAHSLEAPAHQWGPLLSNFIYRGNEVTQVMVDWPSDAMDFCKLLMIGAGQAVPMLNQTHITILRHIDVYPTSVEGAVQHNALWDALAIRQLLIELEEPARQVDPEGKITALMGHQLRNIIDEAWEKGAAYHEAFNSGPDHSLGWGEKLDSKHPAKSITLDKLVRKAELLNNG